MYLCSLFKIETWAIGNVAQPEEGAVSKEDVARSRAEVGRAQPRIVPMPDEDEDDDGGVDSDDSDRKSKMSFSYWGADKSRTKALSARVVARRVGGSSYGRESSANAKFGSRRVVPTPTSSSRLRPIANDDTKATANRRFANT
ncbi:hypothetical protein MPER_07816 [Moniliophthora perniciosa FA553]|nr:hypothetical protein MPER_07816 [Moniliophthora perniciosa FA553]